MDASKVCMARSAKGQKVLCVDDYLYVYDGRKQPEIYRWVCSRKKSKSPCESRLTTMLIENEVGMTVHQVETIYGEHTHERCTPREVSRVVERKRLADLVAQSHSTETDVGKRKNNEAYNHLKRFKNGHGVDVSRIMLEIEDKERVYILCRSDGRKMACVDGKLYYLIGKSVKHEIYRWQCVRNRDVACTTQIHTEATINGSHRRCQMPGVDEQDHSHGSYTAKNLTSILIKHNISIIDDEDIAETLAKSSIERFITTGECEKTDDIIVEENISYSSGNSKFSAFDSEQVSFVQMERCKAHSSDPLLENDPSKFRFLRSANGRKLLCMNRYIYHLESSVKFNGHLSWSCNKKRVEGIKCNARIRMAFKNNEPYIYKVSAQHFHKPSLEDIKMSMQRGQDFAFSEFVKMISIKNKSQSSILTLSSDNDENSDELDSIDEHLQTCDLPTTICKMRTRATTNATINNEFVDMVDDDRIEDDHDDIAQMQELDMVEEYLEEVEENFLLEYSRDLAPMKARKRYTGNVMESTKDVSAKNSTNQVAQEIDMDLTKISKLRSAKGNELLCIDGFIFHAKNKNLLYRNYWICIKCRDPKYLCKSRVSTVPTENGGIRVLKVHHRHSHPVFEDDIKRRLYNEINNKSNKKCKFKPLFFLEKSIDEINEEYGDLVVKHLVADMDGKEIKEEQQIETQEANEEEVDSLNIK